MEFSIRKAVATDAEALVAILEGIAAEGVYTAIDRPWSAAEQRRYLAGLSPREAVHVAVAADGAVIGYQTLELWAATIHSMAHVAQLGTYLKPGWRRRGVGKAMFRATLEFARERGFGKFVIQVRAANTAALGFYRRLGFKECGRFRSQVRIGEQEDDEVLMEYFL